MAWKNTIKNAILNALVHQYNGNSAASTKFHCLLPAGCVCIRQCRRLVATASLPEVQRSPAAGTIALT